MCSSRPSRLATALALSSPPSLLCLGLLRPVPSLRRTTFASTNRPIKSTSGARPSSSQRPTTSVSSPSLFLRRARAHSASLQPTTRKPIVSHLCFSLPPRQLTVPLPSRHSQLQPVRLLPLGAPLPPRSADILILAVPRGQTTTTRRSLSIPMSTAVHKEEGATISCRSSIYTLSVRIFICKDTTASH